ncbi:MAG: trypsin-like peptidase domain-containing protein [Oscillospiraceae bacterium]|nr:trypsin-like peptidase domain-containing protein [Oscillospiraceae bacterium]
MKKNKTVRTVICVCLIALLLIGGAAYGAFRYVDGRIQQLNQARIADTGSVAPVSMEAESPISQMANLQLNPRSGDLLDPTEIYELATQQVVGISTEVTSTNVFGQMVTGAISGTGFIISSDGYILTNNHVVETAYKQNLKVTVMLYDGTEYEAQIVGVEGDNNDIAVLKIEATGLNAATLGNSDDMKVGESVYLVGNPLGELTYTMTAGIISALDREIAAEQDASVNMFQLDAAVNSGNSGGPVYNSRGQVIGVVTAKYQSTGVEGLGFAIPINDAAEIADELIDHGYVTGKPYFGIMVKTMSEQYAAYYNSVPGVYVYSVDAGSCAAAAGIRQGDVITKLGDEEIKTNADLSTAKKAYKAGDTAEVTVYRGGEYLTLTVVFDEKKPDRPSSEATPEEAQPEESAPAQAPEGEGGGQSLWDFFFGQVVPKGDEEPEETPAPRGEGAPGHFGS